MSPSWPPTRASGWSRDEGTASADGVLRDADGSRERRGGAGRPALRGGGGSARGWAGRRALELFDSQLGSRHLDLMARLMRSRDQGFYTIGSAGHEGNAAVAAAL